MMSRLGLHPFALLAALGALSCSDDDAPRGPASGTSSSATTTSSGATSSSSGTGGAGGGAPAASVELTAVKNEAFSKDWAPLVRRTGGLTLGFARSLASPSGLVALREDGALFAEYEVPGSETMELVTGFDLDADGTPDFGLVSVAPTPQPTCSPGAAGAQQDRTLSIYAGAKDKPDDPPTPLPAMVVSDSCISINGAAPTAYPGLARLSIHCGDVPGLIAVTPQYAPQGYLVQRGKDGFATLGVITPETVAYEAYPAAVPSAHTPGGQKWVQFTQPFVGFLFAPGGEVRYLAATSARVLTYLYAPRPANPQAATLASDAPYLARPDIVGRNYGLFEWDEASGLLWKIGGGPMTSLYDQLAKKDPAAGDFWAGIERGLFTYDVATATYPSAQFVSYAHDQSNAAAYDGRLLHPGHASLPTGGAPRMAYSVFRFEYDAGAGQPPTGGHWEATLTKPGSSETDRTIPDLVVWDVLVREAGEVDVLASPIDDTPVGVPASSTDDSPPVPTSFVMGRYFPKEETQVLRWRAADDAWSLVRTLDGVPYVGVGMPTARTTFSSSGVLQRAVVALDSAEHAHAVLVMRVGDAFVETPMDW